MGYASTWSEISRRFVSLVGYFLAGKIRETYAFLYDRLQHFIGTGDVQTAAMLSCTFQVRPNKVPSALFGQKVTLYRKKGERVLFTNKKYH